MTVAWAVDQDEGRRRHIASHYHGIQVTARYEQALADPSVDAVVIATPAATHHDLALAALRAGKHVLCEKPLAVTSDECTELVAAAAAAGVVLMVGHVFLFNPGILKLKELIDSGELGRLYYATATWANPGPIREDVGAAFDLAAHEISIFNFLLGALPETVSAVGQSYVRPGVEDVAFITLRYPEDVTAGIMVSWLNPKKVRTVSLVGHKKMVIFDDTAQAPVSVQSGGGADEPYYESFGEFHLLARAGEATIPSIAAEEPLRRQACAFIEAIARGRATAASGEHGRAVVQVLEAVQASMRGGGVPVPVDVGPGSATVR